MKKGDKWYTKVSNWLIIVACAILVPILVMNMCIIFQAQTEGDKVPSVLGYKPFIVLSGSMETEIKKGDLIITKITDPATLEINDVIAFRDAQDTVTTHRIIDIVTIEETQYFITKGDNNDSQDQNLVEFGDVEGIYVTRIPGIGAMMDSLSKPTTILIVILGITVIFVIGFSISNKKQREIERQEFLEFKMMKEKEQQEKEAAEKKSSTKKKSSKKSN